MLYLANPCGNDEITSAMGHGAIGFIDTPKQGNRRPSGVLWCADNGCFSERWEPEEWWRFLVANASDASSCLFATAPDVVGDAAATEKRARPWLARIRDLGYPVAYVAQDGMEFSSWDLWDEIDCLFIGGTTARGSWGRSRAISQRSARRWASGSMLGGSIASGGSATRRPSGRTRATGPT